MDLLEIGSQCSHSSCDQVDFLPILCRCNKYFCRHHIASDLHSCSVDISPNATLASFHKLQRCAVDVCGRPSLNAFHSNDFNSKPTCSQCRKSFCADHRHPESHDCPVTYTPGPQKSASARLLLAKNFPPSSGKAAPQRAPKIPTNLTKLAHYRKVELIKLRHQAVPGNPVDSSYTPQDHRLHLRLQVDEQTEKVFWFRKTTVTGKVLDCLASHLGMASSASHPLQLLKVSRSPPQQGEKCVLLNDRAIVDNIEDGELLVVAALE